MILDEHPLSRKPQEVRAMKLADNNQLRDAGVKTVHPYRCRFSIWAWEHYRDDGSCRCDDRNHHEMQSWGYVWDTSQAEWSVPR